MPRQANTPGLLRGVFDQYITAPHGLARRQFHLRLVRRQAVQLIDHLLDFAQIEQFALLAGEAHGQLTVSDSAAFGSLQALQLTFDHLDLEIAAGKVLQQQIRATGDQAFGQITVGDHLEHCVELRHTKTLAEVGLDQMSSLTFSQRIRAAQLDGFDREAAGVDRCCRGCRRFGFTRQVFELLKAPLLLFEQAVLAVTDQVGDAGGVLRRGRLRPSGGAQAKKSGQQA